MIALRAVTAVLLLSTTAGCAATRAAWPAHPGETATSLEGATAQYRQSLRTICDTGVTAEIRRRYDEAVRAAEAARHGGGRQSNFWGPRHPEAAYNDCFQSPGFL
jgi:hypothetical protein